MDQEADYLGENPSCLSLARTLGEATDLCPCFLHV